MKKKSERETYSDEFYKYRNKETRYSGEKILTILLYMMPNIKSTIDVGCGIGTFLSVLKEKGIKEIQGIDGPWVNKEFLVIPPECFIEQDLSQETNLAGKFDLAISLEVAEHLPEERAAHFITSLTQLADFVLFSAAIPYQWGINHVNEQWPEYWTNLFNSHGYIGLDILRKQIWNDERIPFWYKQNILFFVKKERVSDLRLKNELSELNPISLVHPKIYLSMREDMTSIEGSWKLFVSAVKLWIKQKLKTATDKIKGVCCWLLC